MVRIDDEVRLDAILNPSHNVSQDRMLNRNSSEVNVPEVVDLHTDESSSTSETTSNSNVSDTNNSVALSSGEDDPNVEVEDIPPIVLPTSLLSTPPIFAQPSVHNPTSF